MAMPDRGDIRNQLATLLKADAGIAALINVDNITAYKITNPNRRRVIGIQSLGTGGDPMAKILRTDHTLAIVVAVLVSGQAANLTQAEAEDVLDDLNSAIRAFLQAHRTDSNWLDMRQDGDSVVEDFTADSGGVYIQESFPLRIRIT